MEGCRPWKNCLESSSTVPIPAKNHEVQLFLKEKRRENQFRCVRLPWNCSSCCPAVPSNMLNVNVRYPPIALDLSKT